MSPDPAFDGLNLYGYVRNNPLNLVDPNGLSATNSRHNPIPVAGSGAAEGTIFAIGKGSEAGFYGANQFDAMTANKPVYQASSKGLDIGTASAIGEMGAASRGATDPFVAAAQARLGGGESSGVVGDALTGLAVLGMVGSDAIRTDGTGSALGIPGGSGTGQGSRAAQAVWGTAMAGMIFLPGLAQGMNGLRAAGASSRVFWSGSREAAIHAAEFASSIGGKTLEMTVTGKLLGAMTSQKTWPVMKPLWALASARFAQGAKGSVHVFHSAKGVNVNSIWRAVEYPILQKNGIGVNYHVSP